MAGGNDDQCPENRPQQEYIIFFFSFRPSFKIIEADNDDCKAADNSRAL